jgi:hypothetical protein
MPRLRFLAVALLALVLVGSPTQTGRSADDTNGTSYAPPAVSATYPAADNSSCVIYALADMGYDSDLGRWIAQTIPEMIEPKSWQGYGGGAIRYYASKNILIIRNSAPTHAKVDSFLRDLKKSMPKGSGSGFATGKKSPSASVVPAEYRAPALLRASSPVPETSSYPVPAPAQPPKHLFHFLIRYEGDGIIDDNVVKFMKAYYQAEKGIAGKPPSYAAGVCQPAVTPSIGVLVAPAATAAPTEANATKEKQDKTDDEKGNRVKEP